MNIKEINKAKSPIIKIDNKLEQFADKILFPEKLEKANETLRSANLPAQGKRSLGPATSQKRKSPPVPRS